MALKLGTENKKQVAIAGVLGVVVLGLVIKTLVSSFSGPAPVLPPAAQNTSSSAAAQPPAPVRITASREAIKAPRLNASLDPTLHFEIMAQAESLNYTGRGRNIFSQSSAPLPVIPKVTAPIRPNLVPVTSVATGPPPPPPIDLKFFGYSAQKSGTRKAFLLHGDDVFIASEGEVVDHRYKVVKISAFTVEMEDLPNHDTQTLTLTPN